MPSSARDTVASTCSSPETRDTSSAFSNDAHALADAFSSGVPVDPMRVSFAAIHSAQAVTADATNS